MNRLVFYILIFVFYTLSFTQERNSRTSRYGFEVNSRPPIYYNTFISYKDNINLIFSLNIQNDLLQFKKVNENYIAKYEISINIKDVNEEQTLFSESWYEKVKIDDFHETNSKSLYQNSRKTFGIDFVPGKYKLLLELRDSQTGKNLHSKRNIEIINQSSAKIKHSNLALIDNYDSDKDIKISSYNDITELNTALKILFEYASPEQDSLKISSHIYKIEEEQNSLVHEAKFSILPELNFKYFIEEIDDLLLEEGEYLLKYEIAQSSNNVTLMDTIKVVWFDKPIYLYKYDLALRPMMYLLTPEEYEKAEDLSTDELEIWFKKYWKEKDDKPETHFNEVQHEFYLRVQKSITDYSLRFKEGWRTERGKTLILYGEPTRIDRHHHIAKSKPFEIWYYDNLNKKITFLDKNNNSDFKLVSVESIEDD